MMCATAGTNRPPDAREATGAAVGNTYKEALVARIFTFLQSYLTTRNPHSPEHSDDDRGATMVEYGLIVSVIALVVVVGAAVFGSALSTFFSDLAGSL
jgi:Flp pilus assembly pilin Flp